jgi:type I restriction enzyme S subunit
MIDGVRPYPSYKQARLSWLERVPAHWVEERSKVLFREVDERSTTGAEPLMSVSHVTGVTLRKSNVTMFMAESTVGHKICRPNDIVVNTMWAFMGALGVAYQEGVVSPSYGVYRPRQTGGHLPSYLDRLLRTSAYTAEYTCRSTGITSSRLRLYPDRFLRIPLLHPPIEEQRAIVRFLDHADLLIRRYIRAKKNLIALLNEQRQAIIHQAVSRGLDPNVKLKASGVEWLGKVPEHWNVARAGSVTDFISSKAHEQFVEPEGEHICVTARFVSTDGRSFRRCSTNLNPAQRGDVLMVMSDLPRGRALARAYFVNDARSYAVNQRVCILRPKHVHPHYLAFVTNRHPELLLHDDGFNQTHLPNSAFKTMRLTLPPVEEQAAIADFLGQATGTIAGMAEGNAHEIDLLHEYRNRLISDVVTGKLDVREEAACLPEDIEGPELSEEEEDVAQTEEGLAGEDMEEALAEAEA